MSRLGIMKLLLAVGLACLCACTSKAEKMFCLLEESRLYCQDFLSRDGDCPEDEDWVLFKGGCDGAVDAGIVAPFVKKTRKGDITVYCWHDGEAFCE